MKEHNYVMWGEKQAVNILFVTQTEAEVVWSRADGSDGRFQFLRLPEAKVAVFLVGWFCGEVLRAVSSCFWKLNLGSAFFST